MHAHSELFHFWLMVAHTVVWERQQEERAVGVPPGWFRNDFSPSAPPPRDPTAEAAATIRAQTEAETGTGAFADVGPRSAIEAKYQPVYTDIALKNAKQALPGILDLAREASPVATQLQTESARAQRTADLQDVQTLGPQYLAALKAMDPAKSGILDVLNQQALDGLNNPALTPFEERQFQQGYRSAASGRLGNTGQAGTAAEAFYMMDQARNRQLQNRAFAQGVVNQDQSVYGDPFLAITGRSSGVSPLGYTQQAGAMQPNPITSAPNAANFQNAFDTNFNAQAAANNAGAAASASIFGGLIGGGLGALGNLGGAYLRCWVAREVFGAENPMWLRFRDWLDVCAPAWFRWAYLGYGERFAGWIKDKPRLKAGIRWWMRGRVASLNKRGVK